MSEHVSIERMNEALDGLLSAAESDRLARHVDGCAACRNEYARLSETLEAVRALPRGATPPPEAWQGIAAKISAAEQGSGGGGDAGSSDDAVTVYRFPAVEARARRIALSIPQLAAAAALVALLSAAVVWFALDGAGARMSPEVAATTSQPELGRAARAVAMEGQPYIEVVDQLERILVEGKGVLAPETLASIEESLLTLDAAIADVEAALADDPASPLLLRLLANHQRTKLGVLQRAAAAVQAQT